jgi:hypothetical protein
MPFSSIIHYCFKSFKAVLDAGKMFVFLIIGRLISQKRKEFLQNLFRIYEVLMIVKLIVLTKLESVDLKFTADVTVVP